MALGVTALMATATLWFGSPSGLFSPMVYIMSTVVLMTCLYLVCMRNPPQSIEAIACAGIVALCFLAANWATVEGRTTEVEVLLLGLSMACTALLPWGTGKQITVAVAALASILLNSHAVTGDALMANMPGVMPAVALLLAVSVYGTYELGSKRRKATRDELALERAESHVRVVNALLERRVEQRNVELGMLVEELQSFSYTISHDLRSPLRGINGFAQVLADEFGEALGPEGRGYLVRLKTATLRMGAMIDSLLALARLSRVALSWAKVDLGLLARNVAHKLEIEEPERSVEWAIEDGLEVHGDAVLLRKVVHNLLTNAWKFTSGRDGARIELGVDQSGAEPVYRVRDNGVGFDMDHAHHLFHPFRRLHREEEFAGAGMGLATVQRIIQRHGGRVWATAATNEGAEFHFTLPHRARPEAQA